MQLPLGCATSFELHVRLGHLTIILTHCTQVPLLNVRVGKDQKPLSLNVRNDASIYIVNGTDQDASLLRATISRQCLASLSQADPLNKVTVPFGTVLCGFGRGKFKQFSADDAELEDESVSALVYNMQPTTLVLHDNKLIEVAELLTSRMASGSAGVKVAYHNTEQVGSQWNIAKD